MQVGTNEVRNISIKTKSCSKTLNTSVSTESAIHNQKTVLGVKDQNWLKMCAVDAQECAAEGRATELQAIMQQGVQDCERLRQANIYPSDFHCGSNVCLRQLMSARITIRRHTSHWLNTCCGPSSALQQTGHLWQTSSLNCVVYELKLK